MRKIPSFLEALIPVFVLIPLLAINIFVGDGELFGEYSNHLILLFTALVAFVLGIQRGVKIRKIWAEIYENLKSVITPIIILFLVGALAGTWLISGIIPAMVYYGLQVLNPDIFLPASVIISAIISIATGSSWTTSATVGIALIGIGSALGISSGMIAGAVISGAYFGDKMSPLSDTTNLAPAMAGTDLFTHIRYMTITTIPSLIITLLFFSILSLNIDVTGSADLGNLLTSIESIFNISPLLFIVPGIVILLILIKTKPIFALAIGVISAAILAIIMQPQVLQGLGDSQLSVLANSVIFDTTLITDNSKLNELFTASGMWGMKWTVLLITAAMIFGGVMDGVGYLSKITEVLLKRATSIFGLFISTVLSCLGLNAIASDQYLAIVIPGKMYKKAYQDRGLAPENLSRTLEDSGTVTSVLIPWNTCGAYQSGVLGVGVFEYFVFAIFNWISPFVTLFFAYFMIKIRRIRT